MKIPADLRRIFESFIDGGLLPGPRARPARLAQERAQQPRLPVGGGLVDGRGRGAHHEAAVHA